MGEIDERLRDYIESRRKELGLSPTKLSDVSGVTVQGLAPIRRGEIRRYQQRLTGPLCAALGWTSDSIERILTGGDPELVEVEELPASELELLRSLVMKHEDRIAHLEAVVAGMTTRLLALAERSMLPDADDVPSPAESRTAR